jgi:hypothetical protein
MMPRPHPKLVLIPRRQFVQAGMSAAVLGGIGMPARAATDMPPFDPQDPASVLRTVFRMRGSEDGRIAMGWLKARRFGVVDAQITPLFGMVTGTFARHRVLGDGSIENTSFELAFYTDLDSGEVLDTVTMPYTGQTVEVPRLLLGPSKSRTRPVFHELTETRDREERTASEAAMRPVGSTRLERWLGPVTRHDDKLWITEAFSASRVPADPKAATIVYSESVTSQAAYADVLNAELPNIPSTLSYTGITSWRPWMQMGDHPGHTTSSGYGGRAFAADDLPDDYRAMAERFYPDALADPGAVLDRAD